MVRRFPELHGGPGVPFSQLVLHPERLEAPLRWRKHRNIFVGSMTDLFHDYIPFFTVEKILRIIWQCAGQDKDDPEHNFFMLTKCPARMKAFFEWEEYGERPILPENLWLGVTVEDSEQLWRIEKLLQIPGGHKFVCFEPLLGEVFVPGEYFQALKWGIIGCESGARRRPTDIDHVRKLCDQFNTAIVPVYLKQLQVGGKVVKEPPLDSARYLATPEKGGIVCPF